MGLDMDSKIDFKHKMPVQIRFSDVDQFGHVNNSVYFSLYDLAKTSYINDVLGKTDWKKMAIVVANVNANFFMPVFFSDEIVIETAIIHLGHTSLTLLQRAVCRNTGEVKCECRTIMVYFDLEKKEPAILPENYKNIISLYEERSLKSLLQK